MIKRQKMKSRILRFRKPELRLLSVEPPFEVTWPSSGSWYHVMAVNVAEFLPLESKLKSSARTSLGGEQRPDNRSISC